MHITNAEGAGGLCALGLERACGFPPLGESCEEVDQGGRSACVADGSGGWDCDGPNSTATSSGANDDIAGGGLLCGVYPQIVTDDPGRLLTCIEAAFSCVPKPWRRCRLR